MPTPICGAASPAPGAASMVSVRSETSVRSSRSKSTTSRARCRSTGSPKSRIGWMATWVSLGGRGQTSAGAATSSSALPTVSRTAATVRARSSGPRCRLGPAAAAPGRPPVPGTAGTADPAGTAARPGRASTTATGSRSRSRCRATRRAAGSPGRLPRGLHQWQLDRPCSTASGHTSSTRSTDCGCPSGARPGRPPRGCRHENLDVPDPEHAPRVGDATSECRRVDLDPDGVSLRAERTRCSSPRARGQRGAAAARDADHGPHRACRRRRAPGRAPRRPSGRRAGSARRRPRRARR